MAWEEGTTNPPWKAVTSAPEEKPIGKKPERGDRFVRSETPQITDGQLGGGNTERGPEGRNPEGSVDISNADYKEEPTKRRPPH